MSNSYKVVYERDEGGWWIARVVGVLGVHSNGRTIDEARRRVREALSLAVDDAESAELVDDVRLAPEFRRLLRQQRDARSKALELQTRATGLQRVAAKRLSKDLGLGYRDVGTLLGISHQMVQKLAKTKPSAKRATSGRK